MNNYYKYINQRHINSINPQYTVQQYVIKCVDMNITVISIVCVFKLCFEKKKIPKVNKNLNYKKQHD